MNGKCGGMFSLVTTVAATLSCSPPPSRPVPFDFAVPSNLSDMISEPRHNPATREGVALGRRLFFDPRLSRNDDISCATCHRPELGFSDGLARSRGHSERPLSRHTPALLDLAWMNGTFWDGGAKNLESQVYGPLTHVDEMAQDLRTLVQELETDEEMVSMFDAAFADGITVQNLARAIAQFERTLISGHSRYDRFVRGEAGGELSTKELRGLALVGEHCSPCHGSDFFTDFGYHNNGLNDAYPEDSERLAWGRARITHDPNDLGRFKTPTLRNLARTAPYMHDGRFATLQEVLEHYLAGIKPSPTLDPQLLDADGRAAIDLTTAEVDSIIAFLGTLTEDLLPDDGVVAFASVESPRGHSGGSYVVPSRPGHD